MRVITVKVPPPGIASMAFLTRFTSAACSVSRSSSTLGSSLSRCGSIRTPDSRAWTSKNRSTDSTCSFRFPGARSKRAHPGEFEEIVQQILQPRALLVDDIELGPGPPLARRLRVGKILGQQIHVHANHGQRVLDLMRQRAGQFSQLVIVRNQPLQAGLRFRL